MINYFICTQPRSGTHLLRALLAQQGCGNPEEIHKLLIDEGEIKTLDDFYEKCRIGNVSGAVLHKLHFGRHIKHLQKLLSLEAEEHDLRILEALLPEPKFIFFYRRDKVKQAISFKKAHRTGHYTYKGNTDFGAYNEQEITDFILHLSVSESQWMWFFKKHNITPHILAYEDLCENPVESIREILAFLQFNKDHIKINIENLPIRQYNNEVSEKWYRRYILEGNKLLLSEMKK